MARHRGPRGEGSVYRTGGTWIAAFPLGVRDGKRRTKRVRCRSKAAAHTELEQLRRTYGHGIEPTGGTLSAYLAAWLPGHGRSVRPSTLTSYSGHVALHIDPLLGGIPLAKLRPADVTRLVDDLAHKGLSATTITRVVTTLRIALNAAVDERAIPDNPAARTKLPRSEPHPVAALTVDDADAILTAVHGHWSEQIVRVLLGSGMRLGEAIGLDQGDLLLDEGFVRVRISKTQVRAVRITQDAVAALRESLTRAPRRGTNEPVFFGPRSGDRLRGDNVSQVFPRLMRDAGLPHLTPHGLRHAAATIMLSAGIPMRAIADQLGHRNPSITARIYAHVIPELQAETVAALERRPAR
jgi:integrase